MLHCQKPNIARITDILIKTGSDQMPIESSDSEEEVDFLIFRITMVFGTLRDHRLASLVGWSGVKGQDLCCFTAGVFDVRWKPNSTQPPPE